MTASRTVGFAAFTPPWLMFVSPKIPNARLQRAS